MKAIILSAGQGSRLLPLTASRPKCLIEFAGRTLIDWQIDALVANGIRDIVVVVGFRSEAVERALEARGEREARVRTLFNPFYQVADNLGSVWIARGEMTEDFLILNGDTLASPQIVAKLLAEAKAPITVTVDEKSSYDSDDMKVKRDGDRLLAIGKTLPLAEVDAESIGLLYFQGEGVERFVKAVDEMMHRPEGTSSWYLKVIDRIAQTSLVGTVSIRGLAWGEVDYPADVDRGQELAASWMAERG
jgi:choline kinase